MALEVSGEGVDRLLAEAGGHRIQRVPESEKRGRVHTSTVTVAVLSTSIPAADNPYSRRGKDDFRVEWFSGTGKGGQHRNKHQNSARVFHVPTGIKRESQGRKRDSSLREAMDALTAELDRLQAESAHGQVAEVRSAQVGSGMRGDKIRTYRFQDDRVTDHVTNKIARVRDVMRGEFKQLWR